MGHGPREVELASEVALAALADAFAPSAVTGSRDQWAGVVGSLQRVIDVASAAQDAAIVRLAAIEPELLEDGTVVESHRALGHVALDAPAIVSGVLATSAVHAERRVRTAVRLAADGPVGSPTESGLGGLHAAMGSGRVDAYRASVVAEELEEAPAQVRATVVAALHGHLATEDAAHLRRRCRRALARISPDLLRQRAVRARAESGLRRWADEPGVDRWEGTFPSEEAARAWAAIDALARQYVADAVCPTLERARAKALTDLVAGNATVATVLTVTVPAAAVGESAPTRVGCPDPQTPDGAALDAAHEPVGGASGVDVEGEDLVEVTGPGSGQPVVVSRRWLTSTVGAQGSVDAAECHPLTGALHDGAVVDRSVTGTDAEPDRYRPSRRLVEIVRARDRRCRFPGCTVAAVFCDLDHVRPWPAGRTAASNLVCLCRRHHRIKQRPGWGVVLAADGVATWTDPTGRVRATHPVDALHVTLLLGPSDPTRSATASSTASRPRTVLPDGPHSELEFLLEHLGAAPPRAPRGWRDLRDLHGRHGTEVVPQPGTLVLETSGHRPRRRRRLTRGCRETDQPPF